MIEDEESRENADTIGYYAMFEYLNGFRKAITGAKENGKPSLMFILKRLI